MKLRIAQVGSLYENIPPPLYGGTERIVSSLTEGLVRNGHDVTLFATEKADTKARLISVCPEPLARLSIGKTNIMYPLLNFSEVLKREKEFDIIHFHLSLSSDYIGLLVGGLIPSNSIFTIHFTSPIHKGFPDRMKVLDTYKHLNYVSISNSQRIGFEGLNFIDTIYNGLELSQFTFNENPQDYFAWMGKFNPDKGAKEAIKAAKLAGVKLVLAGTIDTEDAIDRSYYEKEIKPLIDGIQIVYVGEKGGREKDDFLGNAKGFLNPISWDEPFGLVSVEAMSTGTPVISFRRGAVTETIKDGETGFLVDTIDQMVEKIKAISEVKRIDCRRWVEEKFTAEKMTENYLNTYRLILHK